MSHSNEDGEDTPNPPTPIRGRDRAPTITIDTSAVNSNSDSDRQTTGESEPTQSEPQTQDTTANNTTSPVERKSGASFESRESRPTSPHNVSFPTGKWTDGPGHNFLTVPEAKRRKDSQDSEEGGHSPTSYGGDTFIPSSVASGEETLSRQHTPSGEPPNNDHIINDEEALKPDPGTEADFEVENNKFAFTPGQLNKLINPKSLSAFHALGGLAGLEKGLRTNRYSGLSIDETDLDGTVSFEDAVNASSDGFTAKEPLRRTTTMGTTTSQARQKRDNSYADRKRIYKDNRLPEKKPKTIWQLAWIAYKDKVLILLSVAAVISLALGIYQAITSTDGEARVQYVEGVAIMIAIIIVVVVGAGNDYKKELQFVRLNRKKEDRYVKVVRSGKTRQILVYDVLVGDVMHMEPGDIIPVDGIYIEGHNVKADESSATGESDVLKKLPAELAYKHIENHEPLSKVDPFIISGSKVQEGVGTFLVTSVGVNSSYGKTMMSLQEEGQTTPLQSKLNVLAEYIAKLGLAAGLLLFVVLFIKFLTQLKSIDGGAAQKGQTFLNIFIVAVTIVVVAVPEGLPLAVTLALSFATRRMMKDNNLVRLLRACETMGNATTICSDKTGTLTQNRMSVVAGAVGTSSRFGDKKGSPTSPKANGNFSPSKGKQANTDEVDDISAVELVSTLDESVRDILEQSIVLNSTAFEGEEDGVPTFIGSKTETALLTFARDYLGMGSINEERANAEIVQLVPFDSGRKCMAVIVKIDEGRYRMFVKGASEIMIAKCSSIIRDPTDSFEGTQISQANIEALNQIVSNYASRSLRTIGMLYKDFTAWPPKGAAVQDDDPSQVEFDRIFKDMTFLSIVGIQDPLRDGVAEAVRQCQIAGVFVRMVTGDNLMTAKAIAVECDIFTPGGVAMEGPKFRKLSRMQMDQIIPRLQVLARSSPEDKRILVKRLKELGETVAVTGDGTNDAPALKTADVGFSMGISGTEVAKEASDIILMDDNFASIVKALAWGRQVNDAVKKFLQFQITVNITAVLLAFVSAVASGDESSVLTAVQLLWVNLIMDTFAALALATDPASMSLLNRKPEPKSAPLITLNMWKMIIGQAIFQLVVTFILNFGGISILSYQTIHEQNQLQTLVFNTFVFMQVFNQWKSVFSFLLTQILANLCSCRRLDNNFNIFEGMLKNKYFIGIQVIIIGAQVLIVFLGSTAFHVHRLNTAQWLYSLILGMLSLPVAIIIRLIPDELIRKFIPHRWSRNRTPQLFISDEERHFEWNPAIEEIREELTFLKKVRGGRLTSIRYKLQHPRETLLPRSRSGSHSRSTHSLPQTPDTENLRVPSEGNSPAQSPDSRPRRRARTNSTFGPAAAMAGIIAGSIGGWGPIDRLHGPGAEPDRESAKFSRGRAHSGLDQQEGIEIHPGTKDDDPIIADNPAIGSLPPSQNPELAPAFHIGRIEQHTPKKDKESEGKGSKSHSRHGSKNDKNDKNDKSGGTGGGDGEAGSSSHR
jgi:P-type Ca2+ transporter type 2C